MRRPNLAPEKKLHVTGQYRVFLAGKYRYLGTDPAKAERERLRLISQNIDGAREAARHGAWLTVAEVLDLYGAHAEGHYADAGQIARVNSACEAAVTVAGGRTADEFDQLDLAEIRVHLLTRPNGKRAGLLSRRYVNSLVGCLQTAWTWAVSRKLAPNGSDVGLRSVRKLRKHKGGVERPRIRPVAAEIVEATLPFCNPVVRAMVQVQRLAGARPGEVCAMTRDAIARPGEIVEAEADGEIIRVSGVTVGGVEVWCYAPAKHKTQARGKFKLIALCPAAQALLAPFLDRAPSAPLFSPREAMKPGARPHGVRPSTEYTEDAYAKSIRKAARRAGAPHWCPLQLRHDAATEADETADRDTTAALLGHATPDMAAVYAEQAFRRAAAYVARRSQQ